MLTTTLTFIVGAAGLAGLPLFAGFFSKDAILAAALHEGHTVLFALLLAGAFMTAFYTFRLVFLAFFGASRMSHDVAHHVHESPPVMTVPLIILAILTAVSGLALGVETSGGTAFARFLAPVFPIEEGEHGLLVPALSVIAAVGGVLLAWMMYGRRPVRAEEIGEPKNALHALLLNKYYVDEIYDAAIVTPIYRLSQWCARVFDLGVIDGAVNGLGQSVTAWARGLRRVQTGFVMNYALTMLVGAVAIVAYLLSRAAR
jgi:NADH-quinone oxidoreductase subunit L